MFLSKHSSGVVILVLSLALQSAVGSSARCLAQETSDQSPFQNLDPSTLPKQFLLDKQIATRSPQTLIVMDLNQDGIDEIIQRDPISLDPMHLPHIVVTDLSGFAYGQIDFEQDQRIAGLTALNNYSTEVRLPLFVALATEKEITFEVWDWRVPELLVSIGPFLKPEEANPKIWDPNVVFCQSTKLYHPNLVFALVGTGHGFYPRAIWCLNLQRGVRLWEYNMAPFPRCALLIPSEPEVPEMLIVGTSSPSNSIQVGGLTDEESVLFALSTSGRRVWHKVIGGKHSDTIIDTLRTGAGRLTLLSASLYHDATPEGWNAIQLWDISTGNPFAEHELPDLLVCAMVLDQPLRGSGRVLIATRSGLIQILDEELFPVFEQDINQEIHEVLGLEDLDGDGSREFILKCGHQWIVLSEEFSPVAAFPDLGETTWFKVARTSPRETPLVLFSWRESTGHYRFSNIPVISHPITSQPWFRWLSIGLAAGLIVGVLFALLWVKSTTLKDLQGGIDQFFMNTEASVLFLNNRGRLLRNTVKKEDEYLINSMESSGWLKDGQAIGSLRELIEPVMKGRETTVSRELPFQDAESFASTRHVVALRSPIKGLTKDCMVIVGKDGCSESEMTAEIATICQALAHHLKNPITSALWTVQHLLTMPDRDASETASTRIDIREQLQALESDLQKLRQTNSRILRFVGLTKGESSEIDINSIVQELVTGIESRTDTQIELELNLDETIPTLSGDSANLRFAIENLLDNALNAIQENGKIRIETTLERNLRENRSGEVELVEEVVLNVEDTGIGIPEGDIERVFRPFVSSDQASTGLGLSITRRIVEQHGGRIELMSKYGFGTIAIIKLPVAGA